LWSARAVGFYFGSADNAIARRILKECWPLALSSVSVMIYMRIDVLMLRWMVGDGAAGNYSAAVRLSELVYFLPMIAAVSVQPMLVRAYQEGSEIYYCRLQRYFDISVLAAYALALPMAFLSTQLIALAYGPRYASAAPVLVIHAWAAIFVFLGVARSQHLINAGFTRFSLMSTLAGALSNVILNMCLIPRWAGLGAAIATVISQGVSAWLSSFAIQAMRRTGWMQSKALFSPIIAWKYLYKL
jgi:PST family polysaccharide transporter